MSAVASIEMHRFAPTRAAAAALGRSGSVGRDPALLTALSGSVGESEKASAAGHGDARLAFAAPIGHVLLLNASVKSRAAVVAPFEV